MEELRQKLNEVDNNSSQLSEMVYSERKNMDDLKQHLHTLEGTSKILENLVSTY